jgi:putative PEP-CTERM system TPR-repeat lipoprotein
MKIMIRIAKAGVLLFLLSMLIACGSSYTDEQYVDRAQEYLEKGELKSASIELKNALRQNPDNMQARWLLGKLHLELGNPAAAEKELTRAKKLGVADELVAPLLARALLEQGKTTKVQQLQRDNLPDDVQATVLSNQGLGKLLEGDQEDAEALIEDALSKNPNSVEALVAKARLLASKKELGQAREQLQAVFQIEPEHAPAWSLLGDIEQLEQNPEKALQAYSKAIDARVNNMGDRLKRAMTLIKLKKNSEAQKDLDILLKQSPLHPGVNYAQGLIYLQSEKLQEAQASFDLALTDKERYPQALYFGGIANFLLGNQQQARSYAEEFYGRYRNNVAARKLLAMIDLSEAKYAEVERLLRPVIEAKEDDVVALNLLSNALMKQGNTEEAIELLTRVAMLQPESPQAQVRLGAGLLMTGDQSSGIEHIESAVQMDPNYQQADVLLVLNHLQQERYEQALQAAEAYRQRNPESATPHNLLARVYLLTNEVAKAKDALQAARKIAPADPAANNALAILALKEEDYKTARAYYQNILSQHKNHLPTLIRLAAIDGREKKEGDMVRRLEQAVDAYPQAIQPRLILAEHYLSKSDPEQVSLLFVDIEKSQRNLPPVLNVIALSQLMQKKFSQAKVTLTKLIETQPDYAQGHYLLAKAYAGLNDQEKMKEELLRSIELEPKHVQARLLLTRLALQEKDKKAVRDSLVVLKEIAPDTLEVVALEISLARLEGESQKALDLAQSFYSNSPSTSSMLMVAAQRKNMGDSAGSIKLQEQWLEKHPDDLVAHLALANAHVVDSRIDSAVEQYRRILKLDQDNLVALNNLAWFLRDKQPQQALEYAQRATNIAPDSAAMMDTLAVVMLKNGQAKQAQRVMDKVLKLAPQDLTMRYHSAMIDAAAGDISTAELKLTELLDSGGEFPEKGEAKKLLAELQTQR